MLSSISPTFRKGTRCLQFGTQIFEDESPRVWRHSWRGKARLIEPGRTSAVRVSAWPPFPQFPHQNGRPVAVHHECRDGDDLQILRKIRLRESFDAIVMRLCPAHHSLAPPIQYDRLRRRGAAACERAQRSRPLQFSENGYRTPGSVRVAKTSARAMRESRCPA
jgi:hypothetical protein